MGTGSSQSNTRDKLTLTEGGIMVKHHQTTKHKKQVKKEKANRKANHNTSALSLVPENSGLQSLPIIPTDGIIDGGEPYTESAMQVITMPDTPPISAATKAFQAQ